MKRNVFIWLVCFCSMLSSCSSVELLTFDQLQPAEITFPTGIRYVGVVDNTPYRSQPKKAILTFGLLNGDGKTCSEALAGALADSKYFDEVVIKDDALNDENTGSSLDSPALSAEKVQGLIQDLNVDLLIVLDQFWVETSRKNVYYPGWSEPYPAIQAKLKPVVKLYLPTRSQPMATLTDVDSLYWDVNMRVSEHDILKEASSWAAVKMANKLVPNWSKSERLYFHGGNIEMRDADVYVREGDWKEAQATWKGLYDRLKKGKTKAKAAYNIALSYEMEGNIEEAEKWVHIASKYVDPASEENMIFKQYLSELVGQKNSHLNLKLQMKRFHNIF